MNPWIPSGFFLLGAGVGSLASAVLHAKEVTLRDYDAVPSSSMVKLGERSHYDGQGSGNVLNDAKGRSDFHLNRRTDFVHRSDG